jgi:short-subunit dehydrogenase
MTYLHTKDGTIPWAFVTNVGNGLGKTFADKLAGHGFNLVLHDAAPHKVAQLQLALQTKYPSRQFRTVIAHPAFCLDGNYASFPDIRATVHGLSLKVFVNNVGPQPMTDETVPGAISDYSEQELANLINKWTLFPTLIISALAPRLAQCAPSLIINIEAPEDLNPHMIPVHASCKAYLKTLTIQLAREMKVLGKSVKVLDIVAGHIAGAAEDGQDGQDAMRTSFLRPSVDKFVAAALDRVGCGETVVIPYLWHTFMFWWPRLLPQSAREALQIKALEALYKQRS